MHQTLKFFNLTSLQALLAFFGTVHTGNIHEIINSIITSYYI